MTTLRGSGTAGPAASAVRRRVHLRAPGRLGAHPAVPESLEERTGMPLLLVEAVRVVDLRLGERPRTGDGGRELRGADRGEARAVAEVRDVQDREHHQE